jgi:hypothetical protein
LCANGGIQSAREANHLLLSGGYASLADAELEQYGAALAVAGPPDAVEAVSAGQAQPGAPLIAIRHQSLEPIPPQAIRAALPTELAEHEIVEQAIDQCDLFQYGRLIDPKEAARRQHDLEQRVAALLERYPGATVAYYGIAHIPLGFLAGYTLSNRYALMQFENDRYARTWDLLQWNEDAPPLRLAGLPNEMVRERGEVAVRVSISYRVLEDVVAEVIPAPLASLELGLEVPRLDPVTSDMQLRSYAQAFREMMDAIHQRLPRATGIHMFYAGPLSLAFRCGQHISKSIHPRVVVYNYTGKDTPAYSWGIDITRPITAADFLVRPLGSLAAPR